MKKVILKPGKDKAIRNRHHWIFSGAAAKKDAKIPPGELVQILAANGDILGTAYWNNNSSLAGRMLAFGADDVYEAIDRALNEAIAFRNTLFSDSNTTGYRLINSEGDRLPGLTVDRYGDFLALQITTCGMDVLRDFIVEKLKEKIPFQGLYEKSSSPARKEEGLGEILSWRIGTPTLHVDMLENGLKFAVDIEHGQKTGFFLDQREMRLLVKQLAHGKRVLNTFCYTGGFSLYAAAGGALHVDSVDISEHALELLQKNIRLNGQEGKHTWFEADVFQFLREKELDYDLVILDPPAFAKRKKDIVPACRGYKDINRQVMQKMPPKSLLITCSCSYHITSELFQQVVFQAAVEAGRRVRIIGRHRLAADHPINLCHPEGDYLKSLVLQLD